MDYGALFLELVVSTSSSGRNTHWVDDGIPVVDQPSLAFPALADIP